MKIIPNPDKDIYNQVTEAVKKNDGYCPCELIKNDDTKCMCKAFKEQTEPGECHCGRFIKQ